MDMIDCREYCLSKPHTSEKTPFDEVTLVFYVGKKMFALIPTDVVGAASMNLKCNPERAVELRERYNAITPGYHMNKKHWNTILLDGSLPVALVRELIDHSYELVLQGMTKKERLELEGGNA